MTKEEYKKIYEEAKSNIICAKAALEINITKYNFILDLLKYHERIDDSNILLFDKEIYDLDSEQYFSIATNLSSKYIEIVGAMNYINGHFCFETDKIIKIVIYPFKYNNKVFYCVIPHPIIYKGIDLQNKIYAKSTKSNRDKYSKLINIISSGGLIDLKHNSNEYYDSYVVAESLKYAYEAAHDILNLKKGENKNDQDLQEKGNRKDSQETSGELSE